MKFMRVSAFFVALPIMAVIASVGPASAYVVCNSNGDCWKTGSKSLDWSGVILKYHDDEWWDANKSDAQYHFHEADGDHQWSRGYWRKGKWVLVD